MSFKAGDKCWTPDSKSFGQGTIVEIGAEDNVKVAHFWGNVQKWYDVTDVKSTPTKEQREAQCSLTFRANHLHDFNPCAANVQMMTDYIRGQEWLWNVESLERAFRALQSKLAPVETQSQKAIESFLRGETPTTKPAQSTEPFRVQVFNQFLQEHPEVAATLANRVALEDYCDEHSWSITLENLKRAYAAPGQRLAPAAAVAAVPAVTTPATPATPALTKADVKRMSPAEYRQAMRERPEELEALGIPVLKTLDANRGRTVRSK